MTLRGLDPCSSSCTIELTNAGIPTVFEFDPFTDARSQIRLLTIHPGSLDGPVTCELRNHSLEPTHQTSDAEVHDALPSYEALSYTRRDNTVQNEILISGTRFLTSGNAYDGLVELRDRSVPRVICIDAICINQQALEEKQHQILLMKIIYERASKVVVWFSRPRGDTDLAVDLLDALHLQLAEATQTAQSMQQIHVPRLRSVQSVDR